ncbi:MAG: hypothetical protein AVDCRST_MAG70-1460, partial [uncultured Thermomicrobiales bacterium]
GAAGGDSPKRPHRVRCSVAGGDAWRRGTAIAGQPGASPVSRPGRPGRV